MQKVIYSLIARGKSVVLVDYDIAKGNYPAVALEALKQTNPQKTFGQYGTIGYIFYTMSKEDYVFLVMVDASYQSRVAVSFLKKISEAFFQKYDKPKRDSAVAHSLKDFVPILKDKMNQYNDPSKVDKLAELKTELTKLEEQALRNMDKVIDRGEKIEVLVKKSQTLSDQSYDMRETSRKVKNKMWWKNKKILIGIVLLLAVILTVVIIVATR